VLLNFQVIIVTASVDTVDFLGPIEVGELVTMKASVNYVGNSSMIVVFVLSLKIYKQAAKKL
jgi:acyl-CoA hydrolase